MIDPKWLREQPEEIRKNVELRRTQGVDVDALVSLDGRRLELVQELEALRHERNAIAERMKSADPEARPELIEKGKTVKENISEMESRLASVENEWRAGMLRLPNKTHPETPVGNSDEENVEVKRFGSTERPSFTPRSHTELAEMHDLLDFTRAAKVSGAKFYFLKGKLALLEQALIRFGMDIAIQEGFELITTPDVAKEEVLIGKGFLPRGPEKQVYYVQDEDLALIGTSEITMLGYHMGETLSGSDLPKKYVAFSHCFRTEAGSYGRESYGLYRVHQFSKVEMFAFAHPTQSEAIHKEFLRIEELFWQKLGIAYRVVDCCSGDLGGSDYRRYDIESWMWGKNNGEGGWGEVTSTSNCLDYQSRGLQIKYDAGEGDRGYVHTLNGTVVATPRALLTIMEQFQQADGTILMPEVLRPYCGFSSIG